MNLGNKILFGVGAAVTVAFMWLMLANAHLKTQLAQAQASQTACSLANDAFTTAVARQNQAVALLRAQSEARRKSALAQAVAARKQARDYTQAADRLAKLQAQGDDCRAANDLLNRFIAAQK